MDGNSLFNQMATTIAGKTSWHAGRKLLYDGKHRASMIKITKDPRVSAHVKQSLDWPRIAVDYLVADCRFDAFENDEFGVTRLLVEADGDRALLSAITNSSIGAVAFIAIIPRDDEVPILVPFSGAEATGIRNARGNELAYGLAVKQRENGVITEWYFFEPGAIHVLNAAGEIKDSLELGVNAMPFIQFSYDPDTATQPFGRSRISDASITSLDSSLRNIGLSEQVSLINLLKGDLLLVNGQPDGLKATEEFQSAVGTLKTLFFDGLDLNGLSLEQLETIELKEVENAISRGAMNFASAVSMLPTSFGEQPSNGSYSEGSMRQLEKPYNHTKNRARETYGSSIKLLATELFKIYAQTEDIEGIRKISPVFREEVRLDRMGAIGDSLQKLSSSLETLQVEFPIPAEFLRELIGIPLRPQVINDELPNFEKARERFRSVAIDGVSTSNYVEVYGV